MKRIVFFLFLLTSLAAGVRADVLTSANEIVQRHLPYIYGSEDLSRGGLDCSGFVQVVFHQACGVDLPNEADKQLDYLLQHGQVWDAQSGWTPETLQPGDLIFFAGPKALPRESQICHVMMYCGNNIMAGAQGEGHQTDGLRAGVGYYRFHPRPPQGVVGENGERFIGHRKVFAYGRFNGTSASPSQAILTATIIRKAASSTPEPEPPPEPPMATLADPRCDLLQPVGTNPRFD